MWTDLCEGHHSTPINTEVSKSHWGQIVKDFKEHSPEFHSVTLETSCNSDIATSDLRRNCYTVLEMGEDLIQASSGEKLWVQRRHNKFKLESFIQQKLL
jgi:hypothetical protein